MEIVDEVFTGLGELLHGHFSIDIKAELGGKGVEIKDSDEGEVSIDLFNESKPTSPQSHAFGLHSRSYGKKDSSDVDDLSRVVFQRVHPKPMGGKDDKQGSAEVKTHVTFEWGGSEPNRTTIGFEGHVYDRNGNGASGGYNFDTNTGRNSVSVGGSVKSDFDQDR